MKSILENLKIVLALVLGFVISAVLIHFIYPQTSPTPPPNLAIKTVIAQSTDLNLRLDQLNVEKINSSNYQLNLDRNYYTVKIFDDKNVELFSGKVLNKYIKFPTDYFGSNPKVDPARETVKTIIPQTLTLYLPYFKNAKRVRFLDEAGKLKLEISVNNLRLPK